MCYWGCRWESYTKGWNEGCACRKPRNIPCPMEQDSDEEDDEIEYPEFDEDDEDV